MVLVVVADEQVVQLGQPQLVVVGDGFVAIATDHVLADVERCGLAARGDQDCAVALAHIEKVDLQFAVALAQQEWGGEQQQDGESKEPDCPMDHWWTSFSDVKRLLSENSAVRSRSV